MHCPMTTTLEVRDVLPLVEHSRATSSSEEACVFYFIATLVGVHEGARVPAALSRVLASLTCVGIGPGELNICICEEAWALETVNISHYVRRELGSVLSGGTQRAFCFLL